MILTSWFRAVIVLVLASGLDYWLGDPWGWPHPVQGMGWFIATTSKPALTHDWPQGLKRAWGVGLALTLILASGLVGWAVVQIARGLHPMLGLGVEAVLLASCLAGRSLRRAAEDVLTPLEVGDIETARQHLRYYVGRDTEHLDRPEILRAVMETVTENATDGVLAPLFYGLIGFCIPSLGGVPLALAYKAASTLDSMIGYRELPYTYLGWFSARLEDGLTWLPCRLAVLTIALLSGHPGQVWAICCRDAPADPSPNAGWSECAYAAALGVQLGGMNFYRGVAKPKPLLGQALYPISSDRIRRALALTRQAALIWLGLGLTVIVMIGVGSG
ncbi:MAG: adenosylcobinamide-phosphate synthase CbiB [Nodosilinea sp.]